MYGGQETQILDEIDLKCFLLNFHGNLCFTECFNIIPKSKFEERQRYVLAEPRKMIKHFQYYLLENSKEENTWYVGEQVGNDAIEFYKCCETLEDALSSL